MYTIIMTLVNHHYRLGAGNNKVVSGYEDEMRIEVKMTENFQEFAYVKNWWLLFEFDVV